MDADDEGALALSYHLYDATGDLVCEGEGPVSLSLGRTISCKKGELLLAIPDDLSEPLRYRLYNRDGALITYSDGARTMIYGLLRMEGQRG